MLLTYCPNSKNQTTIYNIQSKVGGGLVQKSKVESRAKKSKN